ncbi:hypothetical protein UFOVP1290_202 [uncultured Caudovirales phage]|uniref:Uncharacterized protein n=1 Tax=uncultured Caudovirales phage TaxID=2100421 RepID=A0A6J5RKU0_9CAUD|nr:hypothetical protein UFOVP1290_202 [uncultured Caudovirales phage]
MTFKYNEREMLNQLSSIKSFEHNGCELEVKFDGSDETFTATEFVAGSFTRELIQLMEKHFLMEHNDGTLEV